MNVAEELLKEIKEGRIANVEQLEVRKIRLAHGSDLIKNSQILELLDKNDPDYSRIKNLLKIKNVRTASGVSNIAVMWLHGKSCPANCIYCPDVKNVPKSYTGVEPTTMRAIRNNYDPTLQVVNRIRQLNAIGHSTDKCELIIMGGTFLSSETKFQNGFVKGCLDGLNGSKSGTLEEAQIANETARNRCVGLTIETRADFCSNEQIEQMLKLGCTRVEIGVQVINDELLSKVKRGHDAKANVDAIRRLKEKGLKVCAHWMPGLTGLDGKIDEGKELEMFRDLFSSDYSPDEIKIYPTLVIPGTQLYEMWKQGKYSPLTDEQMLRLLIEFKKIVPSWVRIKRVMRDISEHRAEVGAKTTNLRQLAKEAGASCRCIRCREVGHVDKTEGNAELKRIEYEASGGREIFLSFETNSALIGFLRLRLGSAAQVRELHVYGSMVEIDKPGGWQHTGIGKGLMAEAEKIAKDSGYGRISVTSGIGAREYYRKLGYVLQKHYMVKTLRIS
jgi:elongator complex protein 3